MPNTPTPVAPAPMTARECAAEAAATLKKATECATSHPEGSAALLAVAAEWRHLAGDTARTPDMAPARTDDDR
ncbi:hypothetical protein AB0B88_15915 [Micromonospora haikouensis]|uniref:hypothetical protein n=1 Tax=Micromonospora haikouensis TaxID=686309 RepID=UPI0033F037A2